MGQTGHDIRPAHQSGFGILEVMVAIVVLAIVSLTTARASIVSYINLNSSMRNSMATQLAIEKLEQFAATDPSTLTSASGGTESAVKQDNVTFTRTTTVTVNADSSVSVTVAVVATDSARGGRYTASNTFPLWGNT